MATDSIFMNKNLLTNIRKSDQPVYFNGVNKAGDPLLVTLCGDFLDVCTVFYSPDANANLISFSDLRMFTDSLIEYDYSMNAFTLTTSSETQYVFDLKNKLYTCNMRNASVHETVAQREMQYTERELRTARDVRVMLRRLGSPNRFEVADMIKYNVFRNCPYSYDDIYRTYDIYGPDLLELRGKTVRRVPTPATPNRLPRVVPSEIDLFVDIFYVDSDAFLVSVSSKIALTMVDYLGRINTKGNKAHARNTESVKKHLFRHINNYRARNFRIVTVNCDGEGAFNAVADDLRAIGIDVNPHGPGQHVSVVERSIRLIKERVRGIYNTLPYTLPASLLVWLVYFAVNRINIVPRKGGLLHIPPREAFLGRKTDFKIDCRVEFGEYCLTTEPETDNTLKSRVEDCIALMPTSNLQGSVKFLSLRTGRIITRDQWTALPTPRYVIDWMNQKAAEQKQPAVLLNFIYGDVFLQPMPAEIPHHDVVHPPAPVIDIDNNLHNQNILPHAQPEVLNINPYANDANDDVPPDMLADDSDDDADSDDDGNVDDVDPDQVDNVPAPESEESPLPQSPHADIPVPPPADTNRYDLRSSHRGERTIWNSRTGAPSSQSYLNILFEPLFDAYDDSFVYNISVSKAMKKMPAEADKSMTSEVKQILEKGVMHPVRKSSLTQDQIQKVIPSFLFLKEKFDPTTGEFDKLKSRLVAGGHRQDRQMFTWNDTSSPTVNMPFVFLLAALAAKQRRNVRTIDIAGAYLNADMSKSNVLMRLDPVISKIVVKLDPSYKEYVNADGTIIVKLMRALYGSVEASKLWYDLLANVLESDGYVKNSLDPCVFNKSIDGVQCTVMVYVDDLMITSTSSKMIDDLTATLQSKFKSITVHDGKIHSYLGMSFDFSNDGEVKITMQKFIDELMNVYNVSSVSDTPCGNNLFELFPDSPLLDRKQMENFHSIVAKCLYLSKRVRPDILLTVSYLTSRVLEPNQADNRKLGRLLKYLNGTRDMGLILRPGDSTQIEADIDASYGSHSDGKSHSALHLSIGAGNILAKSSKQKLVGKSSTESELIALSDMCSTVVWVREFLIAQGEEPLPAKVYQDNQSAMALIERGRSTAERTRHIKIRYFWVKDRVDMGDINIVYKPTELMIADLLTKPLQGDRFKQLRRMLLNWYY